MSKSSISNKLYQDRLQDLSKIIENNFDINFRKIIVKQGEITVFFTSTMSNAQAIGDYIITPLLRYKDMLDDIEIIKNDIIANYIIKDVASEESVVQHILTGDTVILFSFNTKILYCETKDYTNRAIEEPPTETSLKGSREGFAENLHDNISLIRRRIKTSNLKLEKIMIGTESPTNVVVAFIEGIAPKQFIAYVRNRLYNTEAIAITNSKYLDERLQEKKSFFDTIGYTEKPDIATSLLLEGRIVILVDNTPFAVTAPHFFIENFNVGDDYSLNKYTQNYFRIVRWLAFLIALLLPGLYLALITYHFKLIPSIFVFRMAVTRSGVPFPTVIEIMIMMFFFQVLREAGIRMPQPIGSALSIVGALILGDAAISAGLASEITVLIIALSSISMFLTPKLYGPTVLWSNIILLFAAMLGLPGFYVGFILFCSHIAGLTTCGYPFLYPLGTFRIFNFKDLFLRGDLRKIQGNIFFEDDDK